MNDHDISTIVRSAGHDPAPGELQRLRQLVIEDAPRLRAVADDHLGGGRSWVRSAMLVAAVSLVLSVAIGAVVSLRDDAPAPATTPDPAPSTVPSTAPATVPDDSAPATSAPVVPASVLDGIEGSWLLATVDGVVWTGPSAPLVRVDGSALVGWDGCNGGSWADPTADGLGVASTTLVACAVATPQIFGAAELDFDPAEAVLRLSGSTGVFEFVPIAAGIVPTLDELVGTWKIGSTTVRVSSDSAGDLVIDVGGCGFAVQLDGAVLSPLDLSRTESPESCVDSDAAGLAAALSDSGSELLALQIDDVLYLTVGDDPAAPTEAYALVRSPDEVPDTPVAGGVSLDRGEVFGLGPDWSGEAVPPAQTAEDTLTQITALLGPVGADTGWYRLDVAAIGGDPQCLAGAEYRVLWWGDLSVAFRRLDDAELLWTWSVGDRRASGFGDRGEPTVADTGSPTGLITDAGIGVGSTLDELLAAYPDRLIDTSSVDADGSTLYVSAGGQWPELTNSSIGVTIRDGLVTGYATTLSLC